MRPTLVDSVSPLFSRNAAPALIAVGLLILLSCNEFPALPVATAFSLIALGASIATVSRFAHPAAIIAQLLVYTSLYLFLFGAIEDAANRVSGSGFTILQRADLGTSAGVMAFAIRTCIAAITRDHSASTR